MKGKLVLVAVVGLLLSIAAYADTTNFPGKMNFANGWQVAGTDVDATADELDQYVVTLDIADLSLDATYYVVMPHAGTVDTIYSVIDGAVATADVTITCNIGATPITGGVVTIATASSAAGDIDSASPTAAKTVTAGQAVNCVVAGGGSGGSPRGHVAFVVTR